MWLRWMLASLHLLALPIGLGAVWARSRALRATRAIVDLPRVFVADNLWALAAVLWIATGLLRVFGGYEKDPQYYLHDRVFFAKMALLVAIVLLETWPMVTLIRWRIAVARRTLPDLASAVALSRLSVLQAGLTVAMVFAATALARGFFH